jgi:peptidoglycan/xylan/chitin deacetylase (PgdA/CDA1 family)
MPRAGRCSVKAFDAMNRKLVQSLKANRVPGFGLVTPSGMCEGQGAALGEILDIWLDAGFDLGNHSFSHFDVNNISLARYQADVARGAAAIEPILVKRQQTLKYFRHPFLHAGKDPETKRALEQFLRERNYTVAPVTIDNQEWVFAEAYAKAIDRGDTILQKRIVDSYLTYMDGIFDFFEKLSVEVTGREISQVLLLHANALNADHFDKLAAMMRRRGYRFITVDRALTDPAYRLPDEYAGPNGFSWLHRWALTKGMRMRDEPREPDFIAKLAAPDRR